MPTIKKLELHIGGHFGACYGVTYDNGELVYSVSSHDNVRSIEVRIRPTSESWKAFFKTCDAIGICSWAKRYENPGICDGTQWSFEIVTESFSFESSGDNAYPSFMGKKIIYVDPFSEFLGAVRELLGGKDFS